MSSTKEDLVDLYNKTAGEPTEHENLTFDSFKEKEDDSIVNISDDKEIGNTKDISMPSGSELCSVESDKPTIGLCTMKDIIPSNKETTLEDDLFMIRETPKDPSMIPDLCSQEGDQPAVDLSADEKRKEDMIQVYSPSKDDLYPSQPTIALCPVGETSSPDIFTKPTAKTISEKGDWTPSLKEDTGRSNADFCTDTSSVLVNASDDDELGAHDTTCINLCIKNADELDHEAATAGSVNERSVKLSEDKASQVLSAEAELIVDTSKSTSTKYLVTEKRCESISGEKVDTNHSRDLVMEKDSPGCVLATQAPSVGMKGDSMERLQPKKVLLRRYLHQGNPSIKISSQC